MRLWRHFGSVVWTATAVLLLVVPMWAGGTPSLPRPLEMNDRFAGDVAQLRADVAALTDTPAGDARAALVGPVTNHVNVALKHAPKAARDLLKHAVSELDAVASPDPTTSDSAVAAVASITDALAAIAGGVNAPVAAVPAAPTTSPAAAPAAHPALDASQLDPNRIPRPEARS
jgi:hypothetical protein